MGEILSEFIVIFFIILLGAYIIPAGGFHLYFSRKKVDDPKRIQKKLPTATDLKREIKLSVSAVFIFSIGSTITYQFIKQGHSLLYYNWSEFPMYYHFLSFFLCLIVHDTYFYWTHRFMHLPKFFRYFHKGHHRSFTPSPWAILAFQPLESLIQFGTFLLIVMIIPIHPVVFFLYLLYDSVVNTAGHNGFELVPDWVAKNPILKFGNTVTHHDLHHVDFTKNYGAFFNVWDRLMGTFLDEHPKK